MGSTELEGVTQLAFWTKPSENFFLNLKRHNHSQVSEKFY